LCSFLAEINVDDEEEDNRIVKHATDEKFKVPRYLWYTINIKDKAPSMLQAKIYNFEKFIRFADAERTLKRKERRRKKKLDKNVLHLNL
jgi:hypothetical protein